MARRLHLLAAWEALMLALAVPIWWNTCGAAQATQIAEGLSPIWPAARALVLSIAGAA